VARLTKIARNWRTDTPFDAGRVQTILQLEALEA
jgi:hypothetical protein